jgi:hypothetical protein
MACGAALSVTGRRQRQQATRADFGDHFEGDPINPARTSAEGWKKIFKKNATKWGALQNA